MFLENTNENTAIAESGVADFNELCSIIFESAVSCLDDDERRAYLESEEVQTAVQEGMVGRRTIMRLSKQDDLTRRVKLACLQKAKEDNTAEWQQLRKVQRKRKQLLSKITQRYQNRVSRDAQKAQRALLKVTPNAFTRPITFK